MAGSGLPLVMIHAGVADGRQWNNEFAHFARRYRVIRYDMRGFGRSEPVAGEFSHLHELTMPILLIVGAHDIPYMQASADYLAEKLPSAQKVVIGDAAHLLNMDHPDEFQRLIT